MSSSTRCNRRSNNYVGFALDGQMVAAHPTTEGMAWHIVLDCHDGEPDGRTAEVLAQVTEAVRQYGGDVVVRSA